MKQDSDYWVLEYLCFGAWSEIWLKDPGNVRMCWDLHNVTHIQSFPLEHAARVSIPSPEKIAEY